LRRLNVAPEPAQSGPVEEDGPPLSRAEIIRDAVRHLATRHTATA
jgi:hypothetical protein